MTVRLESVTFDEERGGDARPVVPATRTAMGPSGRLILRAWLDRTTVHGDCPAIAEWACRPGTTLEGSRGRPTDEPVYSDLQGAMSFLGSVGQADLKRLAVFGFCRGGCTRHGGRAHARSA